MNYIKFFGTAFIAGFFFIPLIFLPWMVMAVLPSKTPTDVFFCLLCSAVGVVLTYCCYVVGVRDNPDAG